MNIMMKKHMNALMIAQQLQKNINLEINVLNLVIPLLPNFIIMDNMIALMIVIIVLLLNINQMKIIYVMMIVKTFHLFFIMIKTKNYAFLNVINTF